MIHIALILVAELIMSRRDISWVVIYRNVKRRSKGTLRAFMYLDWKSIYMANTYTQLHIQFVFAVKYRIGLIQPQWKEAAHKYISGIIEKNNHKLLQINSVPDHLHLLVGLRPHQSVSSLIQNAKAESSKWIKEQGFAQTFAWQEGYGAFSYSKSQVPAVIRYIQNQEVHHRKVAFLDEYRKMLSDAEVEWDEQYIFKEPI